jgi:hypothetical protein
VAKTRSIPTSTSIGGKLHHLVVLKVVGHDEHGRPNFARIVYDEAKIAIQEGDEFITAFVPANVIEKKS